MFVFSLGNSSMKWKQSRSNFPVQRESGGRKKIKWQPAGEKTNEKEAECIISVIKTGATLKILQTDQLFARLIPSSLWLLLNWIKRLGIKRQQPIYTLWISSLHKKRKSSSTCAIVGIKRKTRNVNNLTAKRRTKEKSGSACRPVDGSLSVGGVSGSNWTAVIRFWAVQRVRPVGQDVFLFSTCWKRLQLFSCV